MVVVVLNNGVDHVTPEEIENFVEERVDDRQRLRGVKIVDQLPLTPTRKVKRTLLKRRYFWGDLKILFTNLDFGWKLGFM